MMGGIERSWSIQYIITGGNGWSSLKVCVSKQLKPFFKDGNVDCLEELLTGRVMGS